MTMDMQELLVLRDRLVQALANKQQFASASKYAAALEAEAGPVDFNGRKHSIKHLLALIEKVVKVRNLPKAPPKPKAVKPAPVKTTKAAPKESSPVDAKVEEPPAKQDPDDDLIG
jgi:hypothetical protein